MGTETSEIGTVLESHGPQRNRNSNQMSDKGFEFKNGVNQAIGHGAGNVSMMWEELEGF